MSAPTRYCPGCEREVRVTTAGVWFRHHLDPQAPAGQRDRCINSGLDPAEGYFTFEPMPEKPGWNRARWVPA